MKCLAYGIKEDEVVIVEVVMVVVDVGLPNGHLQDVWMTK